MTNTPARKSTELLRKRDALSQVRVSKRLQEALPGAAHRLEHKHGAAELVFCVDGTNSMGGILSLVRRRLVDTLLALSSRHPSLRVAACLYRDNLPDSPESVWFHDRGRFVPASEASAIADFLNAQAHPKYGGDLREDMALALSRIAELDWTSSRRIVLHIGDANSHGFAEPSDALDLGRCPRRLTTDTLLSQLKAASVRLYMVQCWEPHFGSFVRKEYEHLAKETGGRFVGFDSLETAEDVLLFLEAAVSEASGGNVAKLLKQRLHSRLGGETHLALEAAFEEPRALPGTEH